MPCLLNRCIFFFWSWSLDIIITIMPEENFKTKICSEHWKCGRQRVGARATQVKINANVGNRICTNGPNMMILSSLSSSSSWPYHHHCHHCHHDPIIIVIRGLQISVQWWLDGQLHQASIPLGDGGHQVTNIIIMTNNANTNIANNGHQSLSSFHQPNSIIFTEPSSYYCDPWLLMRTWTASSTL